MYVYSHTKSLPAINRMAPNIINAADKSIPDLLSCIIRPKYCCIAIDPASNCTILNPKKENIYKFDYLVQPRGNHFMISPCYVGSTAVIFRSHGRSS